MSGPTLKEESMGIILWKASRKNGNYNRQKNIENSQTQKLTPKNSIATEAPRVTGFRSNPVAPTDCKVAKALPAYTTPIEDWTPAAMDAYAIPVVVKPRA